MSSPPYLDPIVLSFIEGDSILDVACGMGRWGYLCRANFWNTKSGSGDKEPALLIGVDIYLPFLNKVKFHRVYDGVIRAHVAHLPFRSSTFDTVLASEIVEHLQGHEAEMMVEETIRVTSKVTIVTTPKMVRERGGLMTPCGFNPYERHIKGGKPKLLRRLGFRMYGAGFLPSALAPKLQIVLSGLSFIAPLLGTHLVAVRRKDG